MANEETTQKVKSSGVYKSLAELDIMLQKAVDTVNKAFDGIDNLEEASLKYAQEKIDKACEQISDKINTSLEEKKQEACKILKAKYQQALDALSVLKPIIDLLSLEISLDTIVNGLVQTIQAFAQPYVKPYEDAIEFTTTMVTEVMPLLESISGNAIELSNTPQRVNDKLNAISPLLNCDKLNISFTPPDISDIIG